MTRLYLFAEGQTEQTFASILLQPHLARFEVFLHNPILIAHAKKKGRIHRGGGQSYLAMKNDIMRFLKQEKAKNVFFTTMLDLYAIHTNFPCLNESERFRQNPFERVEFLEESLKADIGDSRFIPYIQLHEYEAYLFADPSCFTSIESNCKKAIEALQEVAKQHDTPELINDGSDTAPSKRIGAQFPEYDRAKSLFGPQLAAKIGLPTIRKKCLHFDQWLRQLESLPKS